MEEDQERALFERITTLAVEPKAQAAREEMCRETSSALRKLGEVLWVVGDMLGPDRAEGRSPFGHGRDDTVGLATIVQIGGELGGGAVQLLEVGNKYAASALVRQIVEVEYLAAAFAEDDEIAAEWLRADRDDRRKFWNPGELRKRSGGRFLREDYWDHCDRGGHPTREASPLLRDRRHWSTDMLWVDLAGHLSGVWHSTVKAYGTRAEHLPDPHDDFDHVAAVVARWLEADQLYALMGDLRGKLGPRS